MRVAQQLYRNGKFTDKTGDELTDKGIQLILGFGAKQLLEHIDFYGMLKNDYPFANIILCSTAGEIYDTEVFDDTLSLVIMEFEKTTLQTVSINIKDQAGSFEAGEKIFHALHTPELCYVLVLSDGAMVNGSELVRGIQEVNKGNIPVTGGLAGDADRFISTLIGCNQKPENGNIAAIGFYGNHFTAAHGSLGGWEIFGPEKKVTRSVSNHLFEIDDKSALGIYKQYLGRYAEELPGSALLFPLSVCLPGTNSSVVRTILSIDDETQSMVFAGDIPEGSSVRFMKANFDKLIDAATHAAANTLRHFSDDIQQNPRLALLISCVGRKLILGNRIDEETEAVKNIFGDGTMLCGFYSYGEIAPINTDGRCELQNQTITITTFNEVNL